MEADRRQLKIMREIMVRDAAIFEALAHPRITHCMTCDHEWAGSAIICDWCGNEGEELTN
jgi:hypothetical protein